MFVVMIGGHCDGVYYSFGIDHGFAWVYEYWAYGYHT